MATLTERLRKARRIEIKIGAITFTGDRATPEDLSMALGISDAELCRRKIDGWDGVKECDLIDGGSKEITPFDKELFNEVIGDKVDWFKTISAELLKDASEKFKERQANEKK